MRWIIKPNPEEKSVKKISDDLGVDLNIASLLVNRGITNFEEAKDFSAKTIFITRSVYDERYG